NGPERERAAAVPGDISGYQLPSLDLLDAPPPPVVEDRTQVENRARILEQTLAEFKIEGKVVHIERGPRVTMYEISLAPGIRLSKVTSLADNIAMQLKAESVRIIAPIPGKNTIGIEIPNLTKELVSLREIVGAVNREKKRQALPVCLGKDVSGQALVADLARMPHLLIAGATGSGKSVCINSIILSVMMCCKPDETQLIMVDPKVVELSRFKDIPHLMSPVITDMKRAVAVLDWICQKMDERYEQLSQVSVNNIAKFNALGEEGIRERLDEFASQEEIEAFPKKLPYMVVIIDELADLMMVAGKDVEHHITRLAAKSRAVGIHLILATQRPSVDVITGLIKANMPCRIAFQVASRVDSRTILDGNGAETLLGQGDMLYLPPGVGKLTRAQGVFVSDEELFRVVKYTKSEAAPRYHPDLTGPVIGNSGGAVDISTFDELFMQSGKAIIESQRGSVSLLQRKFGIGYGRASRIIDQLESVGLLGPFRDGKAREILLTLEEFRSKFGGSGRNDDYDDDQDDGSLAGLRDDERERDQLPWDDEE
ncbi:MAG: DNA translocase FtsK, partial [Planctomycetaceae bacterium]|nr:DNA translocase FtsK [Planctomycetaceae bacterium]